MQEKNIQILAGSLLYLSFEKMLKELIVQSEFLKINTIREILVPEKDMINYLVFLKVSLKLGYKTIEDLKDLDLVQKINLAHDFYKEKEIANNERY